jgi:hypothetical protein
MTLTRALAVVFAAAALVAVPGASALRPAPALKVCCGFVAEVYATGLMRPTALAFGPDGLLYATQHRRRSPTASSTRWVSPSSPMAAFSPRTGAAW